MSLRHFSDRLPTFAGIAAVLVFVYPLLLMGLESFQAVGARPALRGLLPWPSPWSLESWRLAFDWVPLARGLFNSLWVVMLALPPTLAVAALAGFALTQLSARAQALAVTLLLVSASIPLTAVWVPRFMLYQWLGWIDSYAPLVAPALTGGSPVFVLLFFLAFRRVPAELVEAARLEGLTWLRLWWQVMLPLVRPTTAVVAVLAGVQVYGNFLEAVLYLKSPVQQTAPLLLHALDLMGATQWPVLMAGACAVTLPVVLALLVLQGGFSANEREGSWSGR